jgi:hypothetical protein
LRSVSRGKPAKNEASEPTWWCARENDLNHDTREIHVSERGSPELDGSRRGEDEEKCGDKERCRKVDDAVWDPSHDVEDRTGIASEDVGNVGAVEDRLECREDRDPDVRSVRLGDELTRVEEEEPGEDGGGGKDELRGKGDEEGEGVDGDEEEFEKERVGHHGEGEDGELWRGNDTSVRVHFELISGRSREQAWRTDKTKKFKGSPVPRQRQ